MESRRGTVTEARCRSIDGRLTPTLSVGRTAAGVENSPGRRHYKRGNRSGLAEEIAMSEQETIERLERELADVRAERDALRERLVRWRALAEGAHPVMAWAVLAKQRRERAGKW